MEIERGFIIMNLLIENNYITLIYVFENKPLDKFKYFINRKCNDIWNDHDNILFRFLFSLWGWK